jgi:hypothetical protein
MFWAGFESAIPASEGLQPHTLFGAATGMIDAALLINN